VLAANLRKIRLTCDFTVSSEDSGDPLVQKALADQAENLALPSRVRQTTPPGQCKAAEATFKALHRRAAQVNFA